MKGKIKIDKETTRGHAFFLYNTAEERLELLAQYFKQGLANHELCIFVTPGSPSDAVKQFKKIRFDISKYVKNQSLRIYEMNPTYLPDGHFATDYMLNNVISFIQEAKDQGYNGLRTAGEMSWIMDHPEATDDAAEYEQRVNSLNAPDSNFVGLCLYPVQDSFSRVIQGAAHTHPSFIYDGQLRSNPYYIPA